MPIFSQAVTDCWKAAFLFGDVLYNDDTFRVTINPALDESSSVMLLEPVGEQVLAVLTPEMAGRAGLYEVKNLSVPVFKQQLAAAGIALHGADHLFFFSEEEKAKLLQEPVEANLRLLTEEDEAAFETFCGGITEEDLDGAFVALDHWLVLGAFEGGKLVCAASMYPWDDSPLADLGVLTSPDYRGKGYARKVTRAICRLALENEYEPQYRCQLDNLASVALAKSVGVSLYAQWDSIAEEELFE